LIRLLHPSTPSRATLLRIAAFAILFLGLAAAVGIDQAASRAQALSADQPSDLLAAAPLAPGDSKHYGYQVGQLSGGVGLLVIRAAQAVAPLGQGRPLAVLIAIASFAAAGVLLLAADKSPA